LKSGSEVVQGHWKWYHSMDWIWFPNSVLQKLCPWDNWLQKCCDLENHVKGPSRSLEMSPFDRGHM